MAKRDRTGGAKFLAAMMSRSMSLEQEHAALILRVRLCREAFKAREGNAENYTDLADLLNICGMMAQERARDDWLAALNAGADAMRAIFGRVTRVGGRYAAKAEELEAITQAINVMDDDIIKEMSVSDFERLAALLHKMKEESDGCYNRAEQRSTVWVQDDGKGTANG